MNIFRRRRARGGEIHAYQAPPQPIRIARGTAAISQAMVDRYGIEWFEGVFPDTDFIVVEKL